MLRLTPGMWNELNAVNHEINKQVTYKTDAELYKKTDFWEIADSEGDCEDYALAKRKELMKRGWPVAALRLAVCIVPGAGGHCVLTVDTDLGTYILDNIEQRVVPWKNVNYKWLYRQEPGKRKWQSLET